MPPFAHAALAAALVLSALGAVVVCLIVILYGFGPPGDESPSRAAKRLIVTRIGHALAAACFAATAILSGVILARSFRPPAPDVALDPRVADLDARVGGQDERIDGIEARARSAEADAARADRRLGDVERAMRGLADEARATDGRVGPRSKRSDGRRRLSAPPVGCQRRREPRSLRWPDLPSGSRRRRPRRLRRRSHPLQHRSRHPQRRSHPLLLWPSPLQLRPWTSRHRLRRRRPGNRIPSQRRALPPAQDRRGRSHPRTA